MDEISAEQFLELRALIDFGGSSRLSGRHFLRGTPNRDLADRGFLSVPGMRQRKSLVVSYLPVRITLKGRKAVAAASQELRALAAEFQEKLERKWEEEPQHD